jgi:hypothetical protein
MRLSIARVVVVVVVVLNFQPNATQRGQAASPSPRSAP